MEDEMTRREKLNWLYDTLKPSHESKFFEQDADALWRGLTSKTDAQLEETYQRQLAISKTTQREINENCQLAGLI